MDVLPQVSLFGHSFVKRLAAHAERRGEELGHELGVNQVCRLSSYGQSGLSFRRILENPGVHVDHVLTGDRHPDVLIVDVGSNDLTPMHASVATVVNDALEFLSILESYQVFPKVVVFLSVIQRKSMGHRGGVSLTTYNHRVKSFNARLASSLRLTANAYMFPQTLINLPKYVCDDGCHLNEAGQIRYRRGLRTVILKYVSRIR